MGMAVAILVSVIWSLLVNFDIIPVLSTVHPLIDFAVKGIIGGFLIIAAKDFAPW